MSMINIGTAWRILWTTKGKDELLMIGVCDYPTDTAAMDKAFEDSWEIFLAQYKDADEAAPLPSERERKLAQDAFSDGWLDLKEFGQGVEDMFQRILKRYKPDDSSDRTPPFYDLGQDE